MMLNGAAPDGSQEETPFSNSEGQATENAGAYVHDPDFDAPFPGMNNQRSDNGTTGIPQEPAPGYGRSAKDPGYGNYKAPVSARNIAVTILLSIITCGIYGLVWLAYLTNDLNAATGNEDDTSGGMVVLFSILTCGLYEIYWAYRASIKVSEMQKMSGKTPDSSLGVIYLLFSVFGMGIIVKALIQSELNKVAGL